MLSVLFYFDDFMKNKKIGRRKNKLIKTNKMLTYIRWTGAALELSLYSHEIFMYTETYCLVTYIYLFQDNMHDNCEIIIYLKAIVPSSEANSMRRTKVNLSKCLVLRG